LGYRGSDPPVIYPERRIENGNSNNYCSKLYYYWISYDDNFESLVE
jgi:hypothetical protein